MRPRRLLFVCVPMMGHVNPLLEPARRLVEQQGGYDVLFVSYEQLGPAVKSAGVPFHSIGPDSRGGADEHHGATTAQPTDAHATKRARMMASAALYTGWEEDMYFPLLRACHTFEPDIIVADMTTLAAHDVAESLKLPLALLGSMPLSLALDLCGYSAFNSASDVPFEDPGVLVMHEHMSLWERHLINPLAKKLFGEGSVMHLSMLRARDTLRERFGLPDMPLGAGPLQVSRRIPRTITILATSWLMEAKRDLPRGWHLVGAMGCDFTHNFPPELQPGQIQAFLDAARAAGRSAMLVATGTSTVLPEATVQAMAGAFAALPDISFVWSLKEESRSSLPDGYCPSHVLILPWVPQTAVLGHPAVKGFLCHGGHTTTNEALATGTAVLCMPLGGDQLVVAQHIKDHGYGLQVSPLNHSAEALTAKILKLLSKPQYAAAAAAAGEKIRSCCGPALTAWLLADFARDPPEVESDSADSSDEDTAVETGGSKAQHRKGKDKAADGEAWWPHFDRQRRTGLARSAISNDSAE